MRCPNCGAPDSRVTDSRDTGEEIRRRRECAACGVRFTTYERIQRAALVVAKRDGRREEFDRAKLLRSIRLACVKRPLPTGALDKLVEEIDSDLQRLGRAEVPASVIGDAALRRLRQIDSVAYVRYASVYRDFDDLDGFVREIREYHSADEEEQAAASSAQLELIPNEYALPPKQRARRGRRPGITKPEIAPSDEASATSPS
ncbi:MAG: transcriptional regulator NrdR [Chloroflexi bacterium]|nr:transcriptional regulator NrdR [Chloroflexota bacterium]MDA1173224.1 transcriptional regulator NrdR [Chloroflexota bacterium]